VEIESLLQQLPAVLDLCKTEAVILERNGTPQAVVISYERYDELMNALEDLQDLEAIAEIEGDIDKNGAIPWDEVRQQLNIEDR
jgi:PHD/YefM family antitoxin component YafN of YafNO toxin-antitoxin module